MRKHSKIEKSLKGNQILSNLSTRTLVGLQPGYHGATLPQPIPWKSNNKIDRAFSLTIASHITVRPKVELSRKRISLLLEQEIIRVCSEGFSLLDYFSFEWMFNYLVGNRKSLEITEKKMQLSVTLANLILLSYRDNWNLLYQTSKVNSEVLDFVENHLGKLSDQKYQSRKQIYQREKFLEVLIEDVQVIMDRSSNSIRYSSYCKGYGESGHSVRRQKTRHSYELDRDDSEAPFRERFSSDLELHYIEDLYYLEQSIKLEKRKA